MLEQAEIRGPVSRDIVLQIHGLYAEIEPLGRRIGGFGTDGVLLAKQARVAVDQERGTEPELIRTTSPITIRSNGFSSTRSGTIISCSKARASGTVHDVSRTSFVPMRCTQAAIRSSWICNRGGRQGF